MVGHWKGVMWLGMNMWMPLRFFMTIYVSRDMNKWVLEAFRNNANCGKDPTNVTSHVGTPRNISGENMTRPGGEVIKVQKTAKIEGYNTRFRTFLRLELRTPRDTSEGRGSSLERSHVALNEYMDAFTFIPRQF